MTETADDISKHYTDHVSMATDPARIQQVGHSVEAIWVEVLKRWLPPQYEIGTRKYILPEADEDNYKSRETDIVVFRPGYPAALREKAEVLASGVAYAFSVKRTLKKSGLREAVEEAANARRHAAGRLGSPKRELTQPFRYGVLAQSHDFSKEPRVNLERSLIEFDEQLAKHPRESLDLVCVADLGVWAKTTQTFVPRFVDERQTSEYYVGTSFIDKATSMSSVYAGFGRSSPTTGLYSPVVASIASLYEHLHHEDVLAEPFHKGMSAANVGGSGGGSVREWSPEEVYSSGVRRNLPSRIVNGIDSEWSMVY